MPCSRERRCSPSDTAVRTVMTLRHHRRRLVCWTWYEGRVSTQSSRLAAVTLASSGSSAFFKQLLNSLRPGAAAADSVNEV